MGCQEGQSAAIEHNWLNQKVYIEWNKEASFYFNGFTLQYLTYEKNNNTVDIVHDDDGND